LYKLFISTYLGGFVGGVWHGLVVVVGVVVVEGEQSHGGQMSRRGSVLSLFEWNNEFPTT
jgi:hypothetical protein